MRRTSSTWVMGPLVAVLLLAGRGAEAVPVDCLGVGCEVTDGNARIATNDSDADLDVFEIGGVDQLYSHRFWITYGANSPVNPLTDNELSVTMTFTAATQDADTRQIVLVFENSILRITITYTLTSTGPTTATVDYAALVENISGDDLDLSLVSYVDFDLDESSGGDTAEYDPGTTTLTQTDVRAIGRAVLVTVPDHFDVGACCDSNVIGRLVDGHLSDDPGPFGPGDAVAAFQYDLALATAGSTTLTGRLEAEVLPGEALPAPLASPLGLLAMAATLLALARRRR